MQQVLNIHYALNIHQVLNVKTKVHFVKLDSSSMEHTLPMEHTPSIGHRFHFPGKLGKIFAAISIQWQKKPTLVKSMLNPGMPPVRKPD